MRARADETAAVRGAWHSSAFTGPNFLRYPPLELMHLPEALWSNSCDRLHHEP
jgi:hypothetical protein